MSGTNKDEVKASVEKFTGLAAQYVDLFNNILDSEDGPPESVVPNKMIMGLSWMHATIEVGIFGDWKPNTYRHRLALSFGQGLTFGYTLRGMVERGEVEL